MTTRYYCYRSLLVMMMVITTHSTSCSLDLQKGEPSDPIECVSSDDCPENKECRGFRCVRTSIVDTDRDGIANDDDNCPEISNPAQQDHEQDGEGDICDVDDDNDGVADEIDNCPLSSNMEQVDLDADGIGDVCDSEVVPLCQCTALQECDETTGTCLEPDVCISDADCNSPRVCVRSACTDNVPECRTDSECAGQCHMETLTCIPEVCHTDSNCPGSLVCFEFYCAQCNSNAQCSGNQLCTNGLCQEDSTTQCQDDNDCLHSRVCNNGNGLCEDSECTDDTYEPNDGHTSDPATIEAGVLSPGTYELTLCAYNEDWFRLDSDPEDGLIVTAEFQPNMGDLQMSLLDNNLRIAARAGIQYNSTARLVLAKFQSSPKYLRLIDPSGYSQPITLTVHNIPGGFCVNDSWEPNDAQENARSVGQDPVSEFRQVKLCAPDSDWFAVRVSAGRTLEIDHRTLDGSPAILEIYAGDTPVARDSTSSTIKSLSQTPTAATTYHIRVHTTAELGDSSGELTFNTRVVNN